MRTLLAGIVGGVVLFAWASLAHMVLGLGVVGMQSLPNEDKVMEAMRANIPQAGLYFFPGMDMASSDPAVYQAWVDKAKKGPVGLLVYQVTGTDMTMAQLLTEFGSNVLVGILAAMIAAQLTGFGTRTIAVTLIGVIASVDINLSYWNWYKFPTDYTMAQTLIAVVGYALMGAAIAAIAKKQD